MFIGRTERVGRNRQTDQQIDIWGFTKTDRKRQTQTDSLIHTDTDTHRVRHKQTYPAP